MDSATPQRGLTNYGMIGEIIAIASGFSGLVVWLGGIRPYLSRHGGVVITGASWGVSAWADWQQCREFAPAKNDAKALTLARYFTFAQIGFVAGIILALCHV
jgi:hypothetical protein